MRRLFRNGVATERGVDFNFNVAAQIQTSFINFRNDKLFTSNSDALLSTARHRGMPAFVWRPDRLAGHR